MSNNRVYTGRVFLLVTGASQGIGAKIAQIFGNSLDPGSSVLLLARNSEKLLVTASALAANNVSVNHVSVDLSTANFNELNDIIKKSLRPSDPAHFDHAVIVHNAGSIGNVSQSTNDMIDFQYWRKYYDLNVFSPAILNSAFMKVFANKKIKKSVINITSLCGIQPMKSVGYYCSGKAAREMFFKVFAEENPEVNVLNYSPGPVDTDMLQTMSNTVGDKDTKASFKEMRDKNVILSTEQTVRRLCDVLLKKKYKSGDHVDYFDEIF